MTRRELWTGSRRVILRLASLLVLAGGGTYILLRLTEGFVLFGGGDPVIGRTPSDLGWSYDAISLPVDDAVTTGWYVPLEQARGVIFYCHGGGGNVSTRLDELRQFRSLGFSVLIYDYAGFGKSTGLPSEKRIYADTQAMWKHLTDEIGVSPATVVIWGRSFGGGAACELASRVTPGALVLESTYTSIPDAAFANYPWFPGRYFTRYHFNNLAKVKSFSAPLLIIHSQEDEVYPFHHGQALFDAAPQPKVLLTVHGFHGAVLNRPDYDAGIVEFLESVLPTRNQPEISLGPALARPAPRYPGQTGA